MQCDSCGKPHPDLKRMPCCSLRRPHVNACPACRGQHSQIPWHCDCETKGNPKCSHNRKFPYVGCNCDWCMHLKSAMVDAWLDMEDGGPEVSEEDKLRRFVGQMVGGNVTVEDGSPSDPGSA